MYFSDNIKYLRKRRGRTQDEVAASLEMKRSTLSGYENKVAQPGIQALVQFSDYFNIAIDTLIKVDLASLPESQMRQLEGGFDVHLKGSSLRILVSTVDAANRDNIELVPERAKAGYTSGYADPEYIDELPVFQLPFLPAGKKYRTFHISGDSMLPIPDGAWVTGAYVQNWLDIKDGDACIVVTLNDGVVFKMVENRLANERKLILSSLNTLYPPYDMALEDIREIWRFVHYISPQMPEAEGDMELVKRGISKIQDEVVLIKNIIAEGNR
jgi:transcriptional regulator with XRE-family HTH domain